MFSAAHLGANAYSNIGVETGVMAAGPHKLILMLFEGARIAVSSALIHMRKGDIPAKGVAISKAINIVDNGLKASLDVEAGGQMALQLDALYEYMSNRLLLANLKNKPELLEEVGRLLSELQEAWELIAHPAHFQPPVASYD
jgi:flagellar protein FliS